MIDAFAGRPRIFRDPIHGDIKWPRNAFGALIRRVVDAPAFQRLRFIRQNAVTNLVFPGAEHSRFTHSVGVAWTASKMLDAITRNSAVELSEEIREDTILAALLHDIGHGPFSHTIEDILRQLGKRFDHETMTVRVLTEDGSRVHELLVTLDEPSRVNYRRYKGEEGGDAPIRIRDRDRDRIVPIEDVDRSIVSKVERRFYKPRLFVPPEIHQDLLRFIHGDPSATP